VVHFLLESQGQVNVIQNLSSISTGRCYATFHFAHTI